MPQIDLSILNQRQTPAFYADTLANRPSAGFIGRIFVSTNTFEFYRDNGTTWDLIGGPGTSTVTGTGANGQVTYWNGTSSITGSNDLFWDSVNGHLGIGTNVPGTALQIDHDQNQFIRLNQTTATNDTKIAFQNSGVALWRIGNSYNAGANDFGIYDVVGAIQPLTVKKTTGQTFIGAETTSSGKLVVNQTASDNGIVLIGTTAPSIRIRNAGTAPTQQVGMAISTGVNNFIQGSASGDFCLFNGSTTASPILLGIYDAAAVNVQEAARISAARNFLIGTTTDNGLKLQVSGSGSLSGSLTTSGITCNGNLGIGLATADVIGYGTGNILGILGQAGNPANIQMGIVGTAGATNTPIGDLNYFGFNGGTSVVARTIIRGSLDGAINSTKFDFFTMASGVTSSKMTLTSAGNVLIGTTTDAGQKLQVNGSSYISGAATFGSYVESIGFRATSSSAFGGTGVGVEIGYSGGLGYIQAYNRGTSAYQPMKLDGSTVSLQISGVEKLGIDSTGTATFTNQVNIGNSVSAAVAVASTHKVSILIGGVQYYLLASNV